MIDHTEGGSWLLGECQRHGFNLKYTEVLPRFPPSKSAKVQVNDTVLETNPAQDPDVGDFFRNLPASDYLPTWYDQRSQGQLGPDEQQAAIKTAVHANTPSVAYLDTLGRTFLTIAHNRFEREACRSTNTSAP